MGEQTERNIYAELLDESIDILKGSWTGKPFCYAGKHYQWDQVTLSIMPIQSPHIPIWVAGAWPHRPSMQRVLRCDRLIPAKMTASGASTEVTPAERQTMARFLHEARQHEQHYAVVIEGEINENDVARLVVSDYACAGATWWLECIAASAYRNGGLAGVRVRITAGPRTLNNLQLAVVEDMGYFLMCACLARSPRRS